MDNNIAIIILTFNNQKIIKKTILAAKKISKNIIILDSHSKDETIKIVKKLKCTIFKRRFTNYSDQRNYIIKKCNNLYKWQLHLDADEIVSVKLANNIKITLKKKETNKAYIIKRYIHFMDKKLIFGASSNWHLRLFPSKTTVCESKKYDQHFISKLKIERIDGQLLDMNTKNLSEWISQHNKWSTLSSTENIRNVSKLVKPRLFGNNIERTRFIKNIFLILPLGIKGFSLFLVKYFLLLGFLDGKAGFIYCFLNALWFHTLIDAKKIELIRKNK